MIPFGAEGERRKITGPGASALKYDLLTALLATAMQGEAETARLALRLSLVITARFNWRSERFSVGLKELARMWGVTDRTAKREMATMRARGWILVEIPAARGRVACYRIVLEQVLAETIPHWDSIGSDYVTRMSGAGQAAPIPTGNVIPLRPAQPVEQGNCPAWTVASERLRQQDPAVFNAWFGGLIPMEEGQGVLTLMASSSFAADYIQTHFHSRILTAVIMADRTIRDIRLTGPG
ncbi:MAG: DnaA N-terminal domain-containing protein [Pseudorhodobacter sp.]